MQLNRTIRTRFRFGSAPEELNLATYSNSPAHYAKGTQSPIPSTEMLNIGLLPLVSVRFQVLFNSPRRGSFHLSLTLLYAIGRQVVFSLRRGSSQIPTEFRVLRSTWGYNKGEIYLSLTGLSPSVVGLSIPFS